MQRAEKKLFLDTMVNRGGTQTAMKLDKLGTTEILKALRFGVDRVFDKKSKGAGGGVTLQLTDADIDQLIDRTVPEGHDPAARIGGTVLRGTKKTVGAAAGAGADAAADAAGAPAP